MPPPFDWTLNLAGFRPDAACLQKPFASDELADRIRVLLDQSVPA